MPLLEIKAPSRYIEVRRPDGTLVSRHLTIEDAIESAVNAPPGITYDVIPPRRTVKVYGSLPLPGGDTQAPTVPGNPTLVSNGATTVTFSWSGSTDNVAVDGYQVFRSGSPIATTSQTSYTDSGLTPSTQYTYAVAAYDAAGNNSGTTGQVPLVVTTSANAAPVWNVSTQALTTNTSYSLSLTDVCSDVDSNPITFSVLSGTLPTGVTFNSVAKTVSGTPTVVQSPSVTFRASDGITTTDQAVVFEVLNADTTAPPVPTMNAATSVSGSSMTVSCGAVTDTTVTDARTSGAVQYTFQRATDAGFTAGVVTEVAQSGTSINLTGLSQGTQYFLRVKARDAAGNESAFSSAVNATTQSSGSYTATHYVAPFASVSGATNDYADLGATSWTNAANSGTPTTLGTAMARRTGNQKAQIAPGVYVGSVATLNRFTPSFAAANAGNSATDMGGFFAQYPAAYNYGLPSLYSDLRNFGTTTTARPVIGPLSGADYVFFDGFYVNEVNALSGGSAGVFQIANGTRGVQYRRCGFDRQGADYTGTSGYNANAVYIHTCYDPVVTDCYFTGRITYPSNARQTSDIEVYDSDNYLLTHNDHYNTITGEHIKENRTPPFSTYGSMEYNRFNNVDGALVQQQGVDNAVRYNLVYGMTSTARYALEFSTGPARPDKIYDINHNTFIVGGSASGWAYANQEIAPAGNLFEDNLIYAANDHTGRFVFNASSITNWDWTAWGIDRNFYYAVNGGNRWTTLAAAVLTALNDWRTHTSQEVSAISGQDPLFVDVGANNYRLQGGSPAAGKGCYVTGTEEIGMRANPTY